MKGLNHKFTGTALKELFSNQSNQTGNIHSSRRMTLQPLPILVQHPECNSRVFKMLFDRV